jgi:hypothetical protein
MVAVNAMLVAGTQDLLTLAARRIPWLSPDLGRATTSVVREPYTPYAAAACSLPLRPSSVPPGQMPKMLPASHLLPRGDPFRCHMVLRMSIVLQAPMTSLRWTDDTISIRVPVKESYYPRPKHVEGVNVHGPHVT